MKQMIGKVLFTSLILAAAGTGVQAQRTPATHVVLITVDGFRPEFYLDSTYGMMTVRQMMKNGVAAEGVDPVFPSVTYPDHTTMVTGVTPAKHGIYYNTPFEPTGQTGKWYWNYDEIKTETIWEAMHKAGRKTACVRWPVTYNAPIDYRIPEYWDYTKKIAGTIATANATSPASLWKEVQDSATGFIRPEDLEAEHDELINDETVARMASYIIRQYKPGFTAVHLACTDHFEHENGREAYMVRAAVTGADRGIKSMLEAVRRAGIADSTLIIVTGDHGFENIYRAFSPNFLLKQAGLIKDVKKGEWKAQFHAVGGGAFLHLKDPADKQTAAQVRMLLNNLPDSLKQYFRIVEKDELNTVGADPSVSLAITGLKGTTINAAMKKVLSPFDKVKGTHGFFPDHKEIETGFVAFGPGLKKGLVIPKMKLLDVAPFIVEATKISFPKTDGQLHKEFFQ